MKLTQCALLLLASLALSRAAETKPPTTVQVVRPFHGEILRYVTLPANVRANQQAVLYAKVAGYVRRVPVDKGQKVKAGELLAELEVPEVAADLKRYQADAKVAGIELQRLNGAQRKAPDLVLPQALDKARAALESANASIERTQSLLGFARIVAPFSGVITMRYVDPGAFVPAATSGGTPASAALLTLMDFNVVRVQTGVPEVEVPNIREGEPVKLTLEELPSRVIDAQVTRFTYALDEATRTMLVEIDVPNDAGELRPGMYATARIGVEKHGEALLLPIQALVMEKAAAFVFKIVEGKAKKTPVTAGFNDGTNFELLKGVTPGEQVILVGQQSITDGQPVQTTEAK